VSQNKNLWCTKGCKDLFENVAGGINIGKINRAILGAKFGC